MSRLTITYADDAAEYWADALMPILERRLNGYVRFGGDDRWFAFVPYEVMEARGADCWGFVFGSLWDKPGEPPAEFWEAEGDLEGATIGTHPLGWSSPNMVNHIDGFNLL